MQLTKDEVLKIAKLARIRLTEEEVEKFQKDLSTVFTYVDELLQVNVNGVEEVSQVTGLFNVQRMDTAIQAENRDEILKAAPQTKDDFVQVKAIL